MAPIPEQCRDPTTPLKTSPMYGSSPSMSGRRALFPPVPRGRWGLAADTSQSPGPEGLRDRQVFLLPLLVRRQAGSEMPKNVQT